MGNTEGTGKKKERVQGVGEKYAGTSRLKEKLRRSQGKKEEGAKGEKKAGNKKLVPSGSW